jgi:glyoxylase-like metal-dependent hydrolase (beta-lactamase superfamily II)
LTEDEVVSTKAVALLLLGVVGFGVSLAADETAKGIEVRITRVTEGIHLFNCFNGRRWVNVTAFSGPDGVLLVDAGHEATAERLHDSIKQVSGGKTKYLINTHLHGDHTGGNPVLGRDAIVIAHENTVARLRRSHEEAGEDTAPGFPNKIVSDSMSFAFNGDTVRLIHLPAGHTDGDIVVHFVKAGVVCTGDLVFADALPFIFRRQGGGVDGYIANVGRLHDMFAEDVTYVPGHGRLYTRADLLKYRDMLAGVTKSIREEIRSGKSTSGIFAADVLAPWKDWVSQEYVCDSAFILVVQRDTE